MVFPAYMSLFIDLWKHLPGGMQTSYKCGQEGSWSLLMIYMFILIFQSYHSRWWADNSDRVRHHQPRVVGPAWSPEAPPTPQEPKQPSYPPPQELRHPPPSQAVQKHTPMVVPPPPAIMPAAGQNILLHMIGQQKQLIAQQQSWIAQHFPPPPPRTPTIVVSEVEDLEGDTTPPAWAPVPPSSKAPRMAADKRRGKTKPVAIKAGARAPPIGAPVAWSPAPMGAIGAPIGAPAGWFAQGRNTKQEVKLDIKVKREMKKEVKQEVRQEVVASSASSAA